MLLPRALVPASCLEPLIDDENLLRTFERVAVASGNGDGGTVDGIDDGGCNVGTLHVTSRRLVWLPNDASASSSSSCAGFQTPFTSIVMHALQGSGGGSDGGEEGRRNQGDGDDNEQGTSASSAAIYLQLDDDEDGDDGGEHAAFLGSNGGAFDDAEEDDEDEERKRSSLSPRLPNDLRLVPLSRPGSTCSPPSSIAREIFAAMCEAAALNPGGEGEGSVCDEGDDEDGEWFFDEEEVAAGLKDADANGSTAAATAASRLARYDALLQMPRADDLDELLDDEGRGDRGAEGYSDDEEDDVDDGRFDDPPDATTTTTV